MDLLISLMRAVAHTHDGARIKNIEQHKIAKLESTLIALKTLFVPFNQSPYTSSAMSELSWDLFVANQIFCPRTKVTANDRLRRSLYTEKKLWLITVAFDWCHFRERDCECISYFTFACNSAPWGKKKINK